MLHGTRRGMLSGRYWSSSLREQLPSAILSPSQHPIGNSTLPERLRLGFPWRYRAPAEPELEPGGPHGDAETLRHRSPSIPRRTRIPPGEQWHGTRVFLHGYCRTALPGLTLAGAPRCGQPGRGQPAEPSPAPAPLPAHPPAAPARRGRA